MFLCLLPLFACMKWEYGENEDFSHTGEGLFIICEGNFQYGNASLSYYDPLTETIENEVFYRANSYKLGDVAQSMTIHNGKGWIVVNNSHVIFAIDTDTFRELGRIENLPSPRYIHFVSDDKAYVTQLWDNRIMIVNPLTYKITGQITVPDMLMESGSTEQMVQIGPYVYCNCWSYQNRILKIDTRSDEIVAQLEVGIQPTSLVADCENRLWTLTDGGIEGSPLGREAPALFCIDPESFTVIRRFGFLNSDSPSELTIDSSGSELYWINNDIWRMNVNDSRLPAKPFIESRATKYYGLTLDPSDSEVYVADAIDYQQQGIIYRYSADGKLIDTFYAGVTPGAFCWKKQ